MTAILALDVATSTGWALLDRDGHLTCGVERFTEGDRGARFRSFRAWLLSKATVLEPETVLHGAGVSFERDVRSPAVDLIAFERPVRVQPSFDTSIVLLGLTAQVLDVASLVGVPVAQDRTRDKPERKKKGKLLPARAGRLVLGVMPSTLKVWATGHGDADKEEMLAAARTRWPDLSIADDNVSDALWVLDWTRKGRAL